MGAVDVEQLRRDIAEAEALFDEALREAEARRDGGDGEAGIGELRERHHLVGRVHGDADDVLGQRQLSGNLGIGGDQAGHRVVGIERAVLRQRLHGLKAAPAGDDGIALVAIGVRLVGTDDEVFEQPVGGDRGLEFGICMRVGGVLRTFSGARANRLSGISRMSGSALGAMWFMRISLCMGWGMVGTGAVGTTFRGRPKPDRPRLRLCLRVVLGRPAGRRRQSVQLQSSASAWSLNAASSNRSQWGGAAVLSSA